jgi:hypothetical protein
MSSPSVPEWRDDAPASTTVGVPAVSIIVVSMGVRRRLLRRLETVVADTRRARAEIIVVTPGPLAWLPDLPPGLAAVRFIHAPVGASVAELRRVGASHATGQLLEITTDAPDAPGPTHLQIAADPSPGAS